MLALQSKRTTRSFPGTMLFVVQCVIIAKQLKPTVVGILVWWSTKHSQECYPDGAWWPPAVESPIDVEEAVENRGRYRIFVSRLV